MGTIVKDEVKTKLKLQVLSPIHIGTGEELSLWDFALRGNYMLVIRTDNVLEHLYRRDQDKYEEALSELEEGKGSIDKFLPRENEEIAEEWIAYKIGLHTEVDKGRVKRVSSAIKNISIGSKPVLYIPASEIKGFIRTAVAYCYIRDNFKEFAPKFEKLHPKFSFKRAIEKDLFGDVSNDLMKYLKVEDVYGDFSNQVIGVRIYLSSKVWVENVEAITDGESDSFTIKIDNRLLNAEMGSYIKRWKKCCYEFSKDIIEAEIQFWKDLIKNEKNHTALIRKLGRLNKKEFGDIAGRVKNLNNNIVRKVVNQLEIIKEGNSEGSPVIRIGKFTGYISHTIGLLLGKNLDEFNNDGQQYNISPIGNHIGAKHAKKYLFPLTRRLTLDNQTLGWCRLVESNGDGNTVSKSAEQVKPEER